MPTFLLFKSGAKIGTVVGADLSKLKRLIETHKGAASGFPQSGGRVLGSGENPSRFAASSSSASSLFKRLDGNAVFFGLLSLFILYLYLTNTDGASGSRGPRAPSASHGGEF